MDRLLWMCAFITKRHNSDLMHAREVINTNMSIFFHFSGIFGRKSPIFSLKIEILKIRKHWHAAEDVCFDLKSSYGESHADPERSVEAV